MKNILNYQPETFAHLCHSTDAGQPEDCQVIQGSLPAGGELPLTRMNNCLLLVCTSGEIRATLNDTPHDVSARNLLVCLPDTLLHLEGVVGSTFIAVIATPDYLGRHYNYWQHILPLLRSVEGRNVIPISDAELSKFSQMYACISECRSVGKPSGWTGESLTSGVKMLICALFAKVKSVAAEYEETLRFRDYPNRAAEYFSRFMKLLSLHYKQERRVDYYADRLCVTPKYLAAVIKGVSGKTPGKWIDEAVMREVNFLLKNTNTPIKEIAYQLNFANVSFFGKFFKRYSGMSPQRYRMAA